MPCLWPTSFHPLVFHWLFQYASYVALVVWYWDEPIAPITPGLFTPLSWLLSLPSFHGAAVGVVTAIAACHVALASLAAALPPSIARKIAFEGIPPEMASKATANLQFGTRRKRE